MQYILIYELLLPQVVTDEGENIYFYQQELKVSGCKIILIIPAIIKSEESHSGDQTSGACGASGGFYNEIWQ